MSKRRHNFGTKRFKEKSLFIFHARIALKSLILLFVRLIARGARIGKTHRQTDRHTDRTSTVTLAHARRGLMKHYHSMALYIGKIGYLVVRTMSSASSKVVSHQGMCMPCQLCLQSNTKMRHMNNHVYKHYVEYKEKERSIAKSQSKESYTYAYIDIHRL